VTNSFVVSDLDVIAKLFLSKNSVVFDFDGVIADSVSVKTEAFYDLYKIYGENIASRVVAHHKANSGISRFEKITYYHNSYLGKQLSKKELDALCKKFSNLVVGKVINSQEIKGATEFIKKLFLKKKKCFINSATPQGEIIKIVQERHLEQYFSGVYGSPKTKTEILKLVIDENKLSSENVVMIGDSQSDMEAADILSVDFVGVGKDILTILQGSNKLHYLTEDFSGILKRKRFWY